MTPFIYNDGGREAAGYRWMGENRKRPYRYDHRLWGWWLSPVALVPHAVSEKILTSDGPERPYHHFSTTRQGAEEAFCWAIHERDRQLVGNQAA